jgi:hypothetical protein
VIGGATFAEPLVAVATVWATASCACFPQRINHVCLHLESPKQQHAPTLHVTKGGAIAAAV